MKFTVDDENTGTLSVRISNKKEYVEFPGMDLDKIYQWYPMNICYSLRYQEGTDSIYLYPRGNPPENIDYNYSKSLRTKPAGVVIDDIGPDMMCTNVMKDNVQLMALADSLGLPYMIEHNYTLKETKQGIVHLLDMLDAIKETFELRMNERELKEFKSLPLQERDNVLYSHATEEDKEEMKQLGKLYTMLSLMRKIARERER